MKTFSQRQDEQLNEAKKPKYFSNIETTWKTKGALLNDLTAYIKDNAKDGKAIEELYFELRKVMKFIEDKHIFTK